MSGRDDRSGGRRRLGAAAFDFLRRRELRGWMLGVAMLLLIVAIAPAQAGRLDFQAHTYADGTWYTGITLADMTGDGAPDLLIGNRDTSSLEIWQATPQGELRRIDSIPLIHHVHDVKAADFDHDSDVDIVVGLRSNGLFYVQNTGGPGVVGSWQARSLDSAYSWQVLVADIDGDSHLDIFDGVDGGPIKTFYGQGNGQFTGGRAVDHPTEAMRFPYGFTVFDRNGDQRPDLIGVDGATMRVFINPGNRTAAWSAVANVPLGDYPSLRPRQAMSAVSPAAADLDGNGEIDQVAIVGTPDNPGDAEIVIVKGGAGGGGIEWWPGTLDTIPNRRFAGHVGVADVDGDGRMDIHVGGGAWFDGLRIYLGDGAGWFWREDVPLGYGVGGLNGFAAGDLNGDGGVDLVATRLSHSGGNNGGFVVLSGAARPADGFWTTECVECPLFETDKSLTERALKIDSQGRPHVVVGGRDLLYVWHDGANWHNEVVDFALGQSIAYPALALDAAGRPHVSYRGLDRSLRYATRTAAGWRVEVVETELSYYTGRTSLILDDNGRPHIAYTVGDGSRTVKYATRSGAGWVSERVPADDAHAQSLALGPGSRPALSLVSGEQLQYAFRVGEGVWEISDVAGVQADDSSLAFNSGGMPRIATIRNGAIGYAALESEWSVEAITTAGEAAGLSLAIGPGDVAHVVSYDANTRQVQHAYRVGETWQTRLVATLAGGHGGPALALDATGRPRAAFLDGAFAVALLKFSRADNAANWTWTSAETAATGGILGRPALALDSRSSQPAVSTCDLLRGNAVVARRGLDEWTSRPVPNLGGECEQTWLALDGANNAHVAYLTRDPREVKYAHQTNSGWQQEIVQLATSDELSFAVSATARPHLLYRDQRAGADALVYAYRTTASWQRETVVTGDAYGFKPSLALDSQERPRLVYVNSSPARDELSYAWRDATGWHTETVVTAPFASLLSASLAVGHDNVSRLVYAWEDPRMMVILTYAQRGANGWQKQEVGRYEGSIGPEHLPVLALGPDDAPHVAYSDPRSGVYYGARGVAGWQFQRLVGGAATPALAVDTIGKPHLANSHGSVTYQAFHRNWPALGDPEVSLSAGFYHTCGLRTSGAADCWGATVAGNNHGQAADQSGPFVQVAAGMFFSCGLRPDGRADCWGDYEYGQAEDNAGPFTQISAGENHVCGLRRDGGATCWGMETSSGVTGDQPGPFVQVGAGMQHNCGLRADGRVLCWGYNNNFGQLSAPAGPFTQISVGQRHNCGLLVNGGAVCWGLNDDGQATDQAGPFIQLSAAARHTCGLRRDGTAFCWGLNNAGQTNSPGGLFTQISAGGRFFGEPAQGHTCGLRPNGGIDCWGSNGNGQAVDQNPVFGPFAPSVRLPVILRK